MSRQPGFTLLELCLAIAISVIIFSAALPSLGGLLNERRLKHSFETFDALADEARQLSMSRREAYLLIWERSAIALRQKDSAAEVSHLDFTGNEKYDLALPAALTPNPPRQWVFWPTGTCEPAEVSYSGDAGRWSASYDPLTGRGTLTLHENR